MKTKPDRGRRGLLVALGAATVTPLGAGCATLIRDASTSSDDAIEDPGFVAPPEGTQRRIALVLSGGAARGFAHIGVLRVLEREGLRPDLVVGSSAGAIVGAMYASGMTVARSNARLQRSTGPCCSTSTRCVQSLAASDSVWFPECVWSSSCASTWWYR